MRDVARNPAAQCGHPRRRQRLQQLESGQPPATEIQQLRRRDASVAAALATHGMHRHACREQGIPAEVVAVGQQMQAGAQATIAGAALQPFVRAVAADRTGGDQPAHAQQGCQLAASRQQAGGRIRQRWHRAWQIQHRPRGRQTPRQQPRRDPQPAALHFGADGTRTDLGKTGSQPTGHRTLHCRMACGCADRNVRNGWR
ncbi:hypothetical protein [Rhodanobacter sp. DHB23]|uniref:hypothetical protein n=1 Tax=Rhodanobacter sp. DHB23 TaxID=2775923 RepID=UPI001782FB0E|nr:hypothetical protein [Rhodanobacter sp. DHB23]MBD8871575.1 hypothetical protein [Rhodanobacter sp. DHB23]